MGFHKSFAASGGGDTSDATAVTNDILNGKTAYIASGKVTGDLEIYRPALMQYDGSTGYYTKSYTSSGNKVTCFVYFSRASFTGGGLERLVYNVGPGGTGNDVRCLITIASSDYATTGRRNKIDILVRNSSGAIICRLFTSSNMADGANHFLFFEFDGDAGTAILRVDGVDENDTGNAEYVAPTTGTLDAGASSNLAVGAQPTGSEFFGGNIGAFGMADAGLTAFADFSNGDIPLLIDESGWAQFASSQPLFFNPYGDMEDNRGSAGNMTKNGTITLVAE